MLGVASEKTLGARVGVHVVPDCAAGHTHSAVLDGAGTTSVLGPPVLIGHGPLNIIVTFPPEMDHVHVVQTVLK